MGNSTGELVFIHTLQLHGPDSMNVIPLASLCGIDLSRKCMS